MKKLILASLLIVTAGFAAQGHAALFDDKEARKKILELEATTTTQHQACSCRPLASWRSPLVVSRLRDLLQRGI